LEGVEAEEPQLDVFFAVDKGASALAAVYELRAGGISADCDHAGRSLKGQLTYGQKNARATVIAGPDGWTLRRPGELDVAVEGLEILSTSTPLPFQLDEENVDESLRQRYRWIDLRRPKLQRNIRLRGRMVGTIRRVMEEAGFVDIQTPILWKPTPEGARDF